MSGTSLLPGFKIKLAIEEISTCAVSGAVGTYQHIDPIVEEKVCKKLGLGVETVSNQVIQRDHHAEFLTSLALIGSTIEKIAIEISKIINKLNNKK